MSRNLLTIVVLNLLLPSCLAQTVPSALSARPEVPRWNEHLWLTAPWTSDGTSYRRIQADIDATIKRGTSPVALADKYRKQALANRLDRQAQFTWAYATQKVFEAHLGPADPYALHMLALMDPTNVRTGVATSVYEYERLRFLLTQEALSNDKNHAEVTPLGRRLLARNPGDEMVRINLIYMLMGYPQGVSDALRMAQDWVAQDQTNGVRHAALAAVYDAIGAYSRGRNRVAINKAIAEYKEYLRLAPPNHYHRKRVTLLIRALQEEKPW